MLMMLLLMYFNSRMLLTELKDNIREYLYKNETYKRGDVVVYLWQKDGDKYKIIDELPNNFNLITDKSGCDNQYTSFNQNGNKILVNFDYSNDIKSEITCNFYVDEINGEINE